MPPINAGALQVEYVTADVTALTNANSEPLSTWANEAGIDDVKAAAVVGLEDADIYTAAYDHLEDAIVFATIADGTDPTAGTDVGEVKVRLEGRK